MGLLDIFKFFKIIFGTAKAVRTQRTLGNKLSALPMSTFVPECLRNLNASAGNWEGRALPPNPSAAVLVEKMHLPVELAEFYSQCNGFEAVHGDFPSAILPVEKLRLGAEFNPDLAERLTSYWSEYGNDSENEGLLSVLPPDDLAALASHAADCHVSPSELNQAVPLCEPDGSNFVVLLLNTVNEKLQTGTILDIEGGSATRYPSFKVWLGSHASLFGSFSDRAGI